MTPISAAGQWAGWRHPVGQGHADDFDVLAGAGYGVVEGDAVPVLNDHASAAAQAEDGAPAADDIRRHPGRRCSGR